MKINKELLSELNSEAKRMGKAISWFRFATKTKYGYSFLKDKADQWEKLEQIAEKVAKKYPQCREGQIVDMLSQLVNK